MFKSYSFIILCFMTISTISIGETYRYTNADGEVIYSQFRPKDQQNATIVKAPPPPPSTATKSINKLMGDLQARKDKKKNQEEANKQLAREQEERMRKQNNCNAAKNNLAAYTSDEHTQVFDKEGKALKLSAHERKLKIKRAKEIIKENCQ